MVIKIYFPLRLQTLEVVVDLPVRRGEVHRDYALVFDGPIGKRRVRFEVAYEGLVRRFKLVHPELRRIGQCDYGSLQTPALVDFRPGSGTESRPSGSRITAGHGRRRISY